MMQKMVRFGEGAMELYMHEKVNFSFFLSRDSRCGMLAFLAA